MIKHHFKWQIFDTWNGGKRGTATLRFTSTKTGDEGYSECCDWIHKNTSFSVHEATTNQGYRIKTATGDA